MDINLLLRAGDRACGRVLNSLPKEQIGSPQQYMKTILKEETLPSLDIIYPMLMQVTVPASEFITISQADLNSMLPNTIQHDERYSIVRIPKKITGGHDIASIKSCVPVSYHGNNGTTIGGSYWQDGNYYGRQGNRWGRTSSADLYGAVLGAQLSYADRQLLGTIMGPFRFYFYPPNVLRYTPHSTVLDIVFCLKNDENLVTIDDTAYEGVRRLFILDLKRSIYDQFCLYSEVDTPLGTLDYRIQDWSNCGAERDELFNTYRSTSHFRTTSIRS